jgi:hypothetical protein
MAWGLVSCMKDILARQHGLASASSRSAHASDWQEQLPGRHGEADQLQPPRVASANRPTSLDRFQPLALRQCRPSSAARFARPSLGTNRLVLPRALLSAAIAARCNTRTDRLPTALETEALEAVECGQACQPSIADAREVKRTKACRFGDIRPAT